MWGSAPMTNDAIRRHCLSLPHTTEVVRWEGHLLFKVGGKMFAMIELDGHSCSLKCSPERYAELVEMADILPTSHNMWKYNWVSLESLDALPDAELRDRLTEAHAIVRDGLPAKVKAQLEGRPRASSSRRPGTRVATPAAGARRRKRTSR